MTLAICIKCGEKKHGALTPCIRCGFDPETSEEQAMSIMLSDHNMAAADLTNVSQQIQEGQPIKFDPAGLEEMTAGMEGIDIDKMEAETRRFFNGCLLVVAALVIGVLALIWFIFY